MLPPYSFVGLNLGQRRHLLKLCKPFLLTLRLELRNSQMFFGTTTFPTLYIVIASGAHMLKEIILQDTVRLS